MSSQTFKHCLVVGGSSMLAGDLLPLIAERGMAAKVTATHVSRPAHKPAEALLLDITKREDVFNAVRKLAPDLIINCAAYTNVDKAESDYGGAINLNALGPRYLAEVCAELGIRLFHVSTDYVFNGSANSAAFKEGDKTTPVGVYGWTKFLGEEFIRATLPEEQYVIARTSWLHGIHGNNFVDTIKSAGQKNPELKVVNDQFGGPTWTGWLSEMIVELCQQNASGLFNIASKGVASRYAQAEQVLKLSNVTTKLLPQSSAESARPAPRPVYSALDVTKLESFLGKPAITWEEGISQHLSRR